MGKKKKLITAYCIMLLTSLKRSTTAIAELFQVKGSVFLIKLFLQIAVSFKLVPCTVALASNSKTVLNIARKSSVMKAMNSTCFHTPVCQRIYNCITKIAAYCVYPSSKTNKSPRV
jgi:hypothetical protein